MKGSGALGYIPLPNFENLTGDKMNNFLDKFRDFERKSKIQLIPIVALLMVCVILLEIIGS